MYNLGSAPMGDGGEEGGIAVGEVGFLARWCPIFVYFCALVSFGFWWGGVWCVGSIKDIEESVPFPVLFSLIFSHLPPFFLALNQAGESVFKAWNHSSFLVGYF